MPPIDVQLLLPHLVALLVVGLQGCAEVVGDDGETVTVGDELGSRHERVLLEKPCDHAFFRLFRPFVQRRVAVPNEVRGSSCVCLADATTEGVVGERDLFAVGSDDAGEHAVALPVACGLESTFKFLLLIHSNLFRISRAIAFS